MGHGHRGLHCRTDTRLRGIIWLDAGMLVQVTSGRWGWDVRGRPNWHRGICRIAKQANRGHTIVLNDVPQEMMLHARTLHDHVSIEILTISDRMLGLSFSVWVGADRRIRCGPPFSLFLLGLFQYGSQTLHTIRIIFAALVFYHSEIDRVRTLLNNRAFVLRM